MWTEKGEGKAFLPCVGYTWFIVRCSVEYSICGNDIFRPGKIKDGFSH